MLHALAIVFLAAASAAAAQPESEFAQTRSANVILISLDTLRADHLGVYGYQRNTSPNIDAFANESVVFEKAIAPSSWTLPSHASVFTGLAPSEHGAVVLGDTVVGGHHTTLAELAKDHGYVTGAVTGGGTLAPLTGLAQGFDTYDVITERAEIAFDAAAKWIEGVDEAPFFLFVHTFEIHDPYNPPEEFAERFIDSDAGDLPRSMRPTLRPNFPVANRVVRQGGSIMPNSPAVNDSRLRKHMVDLYDGGIAYTDHVLGEFFRALRDRNLWESTVIVLFSDHGEEFWEHGGVGHGMTLYEEQLHVPLIIKLAGENVPTGRRPAPVPLKDVFGTVVEYLHWNPELAAKNGSLLERITGQLSPPAAVEAIFSELAYYGTNPATPLTQIAIRENAEKLIHHGDPEQTRELYDLASDPNEQRDMAEARSERAEALTIAIEHYKTKTAQSGVLENGQSPPQPPTLDPETLEQLRGLGYIR
jgi:arylsulfatase A-like enzyme